MFSKLSEATAAAPAQEGGEAPSSTPSYSSEGLFRGQKEIVISHQGSSYRLRITRTGGLILNK